MFTSVFPPMTCFRRQFLRKMWPIQLAFLLFTVCMIFLSLLSLNWWKYLMSSMELRGPVPRGRLAKRNKFFACYIPGVAYPFVRKQESTNPARFLLYTECPRRNVPDFGRVFLMLKYTDITQNTYVQSWTVTEIMAREKCGILAGPRAVPVSWQSYPSPSLSVVSYDGNSAHASPKLHTYFLQGDDVVSHVTSVLGIHVSCIVLGTLRTTMTWVRVFLWFNLMALCHSQVSLMLSTDINITETTYSCQF